MILLRQTLGLFSIIYILSSLALECKATLDSEKISMKNIQDGHDTFYLKTSRKMLGVGNNEIIQMNSSSIENDRPWFWFCLVVMIILFFLILIRCCIRLANVQDDETSEIIVHPPPRIQPYSRSYASSSSATRSNTSSISPGRSYTSSRAFASPQTSSRSLILLPEPGIDNTVYLAIENPNFNLFAINLDASDQITPQLNNALPSTLPLNNPPSNTPQLIILPATNSSTQMEDLPPDYESVVAANQQNDNRLSHAIGTSDDVQNSEKMLPPKYEDLQS